MKIFILMRKFLTALFLSTASVAWSQTAAPPARLVLPDSLSVAATTKDVASQAWGYVVWLPTDVSWMAQHDVAVYIKAGLPSSTNSFTKQSIVSWTDDASVLAARAQRASALASSGKEMNDVDGILLTVLQQMQQRAGLSGALPTTRADRLAMLIRRTKVSETDAASVRALGAGHPLFRMAMGQAWAGPLGVAAGQDATIELREVDCVSGVEGAVVGRVTLRAGSPLVLDAPGPPVFVPNSFLTIPGATTPPPTAPLNFNDLALTVPEAKGQDDLAVPLRWGIPEGLRSQALLSSGFVVWRTLDGLAAVSGTVANFQAWEETVINNTRRLTRREPLRTAGWAYSNSPVIASKLFTPVGSSAPGPLVNDFVADSSSFFVSDDNDRYNSNSQGTITGQPYPEGARYNYAVAALDLLGRPGAISPMTSVTVCRTMPPPVPQVIDVQNVVASGNQALRLRWKAAASVPVMTTANAANGQTVSTTHYLIQRDRFKNTAPPANGLMRGSNPEFQNELVTVAIVPQGTGDLEWVDPMVPNATDFGNTYFYCIRALHAGPCGYVASAPSPPVFGTFRDREGPPQPTGTVLTVCPRVGLFYNGETSTTLPSNDQPERVRLRVRVTRQDPGVKLAKVTFTYAAVGHAVVSPTPMTLLFGDGDVVWRDISLPLAEEMEQAADDKIATLTVQCFGAAGSLSHPETQSLIIAPRSGLSPYQRRSSYVKNFTAGTGNPAPDDDTAADLWERHLPGPPQSITVTQSLGTTLTATWPLGLAVRPRVLVVQRLNSTWQTVGMALLPAGQTNFSFQGSPTFSYRAWLIVDPAGSPSHGDCLHDPYAGVTGILQSIQVSLTLSVGAKDYRIYRRLDNGPLVLLAQDAANFTDPQAQTIMKSDAFMPPNGGTLRYYGQVFDEHGNPSALTLLGERIVTLPDLPVPVLEPPTASFGSGSTTMMQLRASCARPGVDRLEFMISPTPETTTMVLAPIDPSTFVFGAHGGGSSAPTPIALDALQSGTKQSQTATTAIVQTASCRVKADKEYGIKVRAVNDDGKTGEWSPTQLFLWSPPLAAGNVPWPSRKLPTVRTHPQIYPILTTATNSLIGVEGLLSSPADFPVGIKIGSVPLTPGKFNISRAVLGATAAATAMQSSGILSFLGTSGTTNWDTYLAPMESAYPGAGVVRTVPVVLYRQQVTAYAGAVNGSAGLSTPNAETIQVSPLVTNLSTTLSTISGSAHTYLTDADVGVLSNAAGTAADIVLWDTTPLAENATYHYYLVRFNPEGEMDQIIHAGEITIPES